MFLAVGEMKGMLSLFAHDLKDGLCLYRKIQGQGRP